jgi:hypothetical protein
VPALAGGAVVVLSLFVCLVGGFSLAGWTLAAALWVAAELLGVWLARIPTGADALGRSGLVAVGMAFRGIGVMVVLLAVTVSERAVGITAAIIYALAYSLSLAVSLIEYFGSEHIA